MTDQQPACERCRWWNRDEAMSVAIAECRRNAPQPADSIMDPRWWSHTRRDDWCGEFKEAPDA